MKVNWSDEFNGTELNSDHWTPEIGNGNWGWGNNGERITIKQTTYLYQMEQ